MPNFPIAGGCLCGAVRYTADAEPAAVVVCHCDDCQRQSGAPFSLNVLIDMTTLNVAGELRVFETVGTESQQPRERKFCATCGSPIMTLLAEMPGMAAIKAGTLDDRSWLQPTMDLWGDRRHAWLTSGVERSEFPGGIPS